MKMMYTLLAICTMLGGMKVITAFIDTGNYKVLIDRAEQNFTLWEGQCQGELKQYV